MDCVRAFLLATIYAAYLIIPCCVLVATYRLFFHPLRQYPGPRLAKLSGLYGAFYAARTSLHLRTWQDHLDHGSVVRQGPNKLVFNTASALKGKIVAIPCGKGLQRKDIYHNERVTKSRAYLASQRLPGVYGLFNALDRGTHQKKRRLLSPVLNDRSTRNFEPAMVHQIDIFLRSLLSSSHYSPSYPVNLAPMLSYLTMDIMALLVFGYPLRLQTETTYRFMTNSRLNHLLNIALQLPILASLIGISRLRFLRTLLRGHSFRDILQRMVRHRLAENQNSKESLLYMTDTSRVSENDEIFVEETLSEATFLLSAGSDTISTCLSALFFYLSRSAHCYERLTREIRSAFSCDSEIRSGPHLAGCRYLRACIDEALRMSPPVPGTLWREQVYNVDGDTQPLVIDGHVIPRGTQIGVNTYALHHNEEYFLDSFVFNPDRFMDRNSKETKAARDAFAPFSLGTRGCLGKTMAYLEISLIIARTLWRFDFEPAPGESGKLGEWSDRRLGDNKGRLNEYQIQDIFGAGHDGPCLTFRPRRGFVDSSQGNGTRV